MVPKKFVASPFTKTTSPIPSIHFISFLFLVIILYSKTKLFPVLIELSKTFWLFGMSSGCVIVLQISKVTSLFISSPTISLNVLDVTATPVFKSKL